MMRITTDPSMIRMNAISAGQLIDFAYDTSPDRLSGAPLWLFRTTYDVVGKTESPAPISDQKKMLCALLAERFGLACHSSVKATQGFVLLSGKRPKLAAAKDPGPEIARFLPGLSVHEDGGTETIFAAHGASLADLAAWLSEMLAKPVSDQTGIAGLFDMEISIPGPALRSRSEEPSQQIDMGREAMLALQAQLGLKLQAEPNTKMETLVIDRIHTASGN